MADTTEQNTDQANEKSLDDFFAKQPAPKVLKVHTSDNACVSCEG